MPFVTVFDITTSGFSDWTFSAFGLIFVAIGFLIVLSTAFIDRLGIPNLNLKSSWLMKFRYAFLGFAVVWTVIAFAGSYSRYSRHRDLAEAHKCMLVTGMVEHFQPMPTSDQGFESFSVSGVRFSYSDYVLNGAFHNTAAHGGPMREGLEVRVCYDPTDHSIPKLEAAK